MSLVRCPTGRPQDCFFQRHAFTGMPASVATFETTNSEGETKTYLSVEDAKGYLALAQFGVVEFHTWGTQRKQLDKPDRIVFDLDPGEGIAWREVVEAAVHIRGELEALGLVPFVKTSGGKGIHIVVPVDAEAQLEEGRITATSDIADALAGDRARHLHHHHGQGQPQAAHLHRLPPQCPQRDGGCALFAARPHQFAGLDAGELGRPGVHRRSGGFELFFAAGFVDQVRAIPGRILNEFARDLPLLSGDQDVIVSPRRRQPWRPEQAGRVTSS